MIVLEISENIFEMWIYFMISTGCIYNSYNAAFYAYTEYIIFSAAMKIINHDQIGEIFTAFAAFCKQSYSLKKLRFII